MPFLRGAIVLVLLTGLASACTRWIRAVIQGRKLVDRDAIKAALTRR